MEDKREEIGRCVICGAAATRLTPSFGPNDFVIAADGGLKCLESRVPDLAIGDFDSLGFVPDKVKVIKLPVRKADTDMLLAIRYGLERGYSRFVLYGGMGGRLDHTIANIQCLVWLVSQGARGMLVGDEQSVVVSGSGDTLRFSRESVGVVSFFAWDGKCDVLLEGFDYPYDGMLSSIYPMGVSNAFVGEEASVSVRSGLLVSIYPTFGAKLVGF